MKFMFFLVAVCFLSFSAFGIEIPGGVNPRTLGKKVSENLLAREKLAMNPKGCLYYAEACSAVGALRFAEKTNDKNLLNRAVSRYESFIKDDGVFHSRKPHVDVNVMGIVPLQISMAINDQRYLKAGLDFADRQWENPRDDGLTDQTRWWIDDMYMVGMLQIQAFRATKDQKYADRAAAQIEAYLKKLQQPNGLFFHGPEFKYYWGRGNGWVAASLAELLLSLPKEHQHYAFIMERYKIMMDALLNFQAENGMWRQLIDYEYSWQESSCTAMFAYAMTVGVKQGWLEKGRYLPAISKAWNALCAHLDREGNLRDVCVGTAQVDDIEFYLNRPRSLGELHGQAPFLWLAVEKLNMEDVLP